MEKRQTRVVAYNLDEDVATAVEVYARAQRRNRSSLVNYLLHQSLLAGQKPPDDIPEQKDGE